MKSFLSIHAEGSVFYDGVCLVDSVTLSTEFVDLPRCVPARGLNGILSESSKRCNREFHSYQQQAFGQWITVHGRGKNGCHAFLTVSISMEVSVKGQEYPGVSAKRHVIQGLSFFRFLKSLFPIFPSKGSANFRKKRVKSSCKYLMNTPTHSSFRQLSNETNHDCLELTVIELELF